jgi:hypothetical protein
MKKKIKIANAGGYWGDDLHALKRQLTGGEIDYISADYLAEITMSILRKQQLKNPSLGYVTDFVEQIVEVADLLVEKKVRMISNAGGINPVGCAKAIYERLGKEHPLKIAVVEGDNIMDKIDALQADGENFTNMETGEDFSVISGKLESANAYFGVPPLVKALETGADLVIVGRHTDTSITMAPMVYEFGWSFDDWDKLAAGLVAGHIIECGAQATGGNFTDWHLIKKWTNFGYPIIEMHDNGDFFVTKHPDTGGLVSVDTIREQLVYEMGDPQYYISPDVVADFLTIKIEQAGENRVKVSGIKGKPSTKFYKVSMAYTDGYKAVGSVILSGNNAVEKAEIFGKLFWDRLKELGYTFVKTNTEMVGYNACHRDLANPIEPNEILLRFYAYDFSREGLQEFAKLLSTIILSGPAGVAVTGGRPRIQGIMSYWPALIRKQGLVSTVKLLDNNANIIQEYEVNPLTGFEQDIDFEKTNRQISQNTAGDYLKLLPSGADYKMVELRKICLARSGDKGDMANIGLIARSPEIYEFIKQNITADFVKSAFKNICKGKVIRYELDNLQALNFLLEESLDGGGTKALVIDPQGKTYASALLNIKIPVPEKLLE